MKWIDNFLKGRVQTVFSNGHFSYPTNVLSGVPQGSVLGPLLFIIYINDLSDAISNSKILTFADDTKLVSKISSATDTSNLQNDLDKITTWSDTNSMKLNNKKFELVSHRLIPENESQIFFQSLPFYNEHHSYKASNQIEISPSDCVKDLGVYIDADLGWNTHIHTISKKCKQISAWVFSVFYTRERHTMLTLFNSLIRPRMEYCCEVWNPDQNKDIGIVEQVQRSFTYRISGMDKFNYWERLQKLNIMSLQRRREKIMITHLWKILHNINPNSINITFKEHQRSSAIQANIKPLPKLNGKVIQGKLLTKYDNSFVIKAARLWNALPPNLTRLTTLSLFKNGLDTFLRTIPDEPPLSGYPYKCDNSIPSQVSVLKLN